MKTLLAVTCLLLSAMLGHAQGVDDLQKSFWERLAANETSKDEDLRQLNKSYEAALQRLMEDFQKAGKLDEVLILREQIANIKQDNDATAQGSEPKGPKELLQLRTKYIESRTGILGKHAAEVVTLVDRANSLLEEQIISLTKAGKIGEAVKAKNTLDKIAADKAILAARTLHGAEVAATAAWTSLTAADMDIVKKGQHVGWLPEPEDDKKQETSPWAKAVRTQSGRQPVLLTYPNCTVRFKFRNGITRFRANLSLTNANGDVTFVVLVDGGEIKREALSGAVQTKPLECSFPATREIELRVKYNRAERNTEWAAWINPEVR